MGSEDDSLSIPTTDYDPLGTFGDVAAKVLGLFGVNWLENIAHLRFGVGGVALARTARSACLYFIVGGLIYLVLAVYGFAVDVHGDANILGVNEAGNWLHAVIFVTMMGIGVVLERQARQALARCMPRPDGATGGAC